MYVIKTRRTAVVVLTAALALLTVSLLFTASGSATNGASFRGTVAYEAYSSKAAGLEALDLATGETRWLVKPSAGARGGTYAWVTWSPDGKWLAFTRWVRSGREDLFVLHADTGKLTNVAASATGCRFKRGGLFPGIHTGYGRVRWSPDGTSIAFTCYTSGADSGVYVVGRGGAGLRRLEALPSAVARDTSLAWSSDGTKLAYLRWRYVKDKQREDQEIVVASVTDGTAVAIPTLPATEKPLPYTVEDLAWQPNGNRVLYASNSWEEFGDALCFADEGHTSIYTVTPPDTTSKRLLELPDVSDAAWSPIGNRIAVHEVGCDPGPLWVMGSEGEEHRLLSASVSWGEEEDWAWAHSGQEILIARYEPSAIRAVNVVTTRSRHLAAWKQTDCCAWILAVGKNTVAADAGGDYPRSQQLALVKLAGSGPKLKLVTVKPSRAGMKLDVFAFDVALP
jgi:Tol biopolymer transport system component